MMCLDKDSRWWSRRSRSWQIYREEIGTRRATWLLVKRMVSDLFDLVSQKIWWLLILAGLVFAVCSVGEARGLWAAPRENVSDRIAFDSLVVSWLTLLLGALGGGWAILQLRQALQRPQLILLKDMLATQDIPIRGSANQIKLKLELLNRSDVLAENVVVMILPSHETREFLKIELTDGPRWKCTDSERQEWQTQDRDILIHGDRREFFGHLEIKRRKVNARLEDLLIWIDRYHRTGKSSERLSVQLFPGGEFPE